MLGTASLLNTPYDDDCPPCAAPVSEKPLPAPADAACAAGVRRVHATAVATSVAQQNRHASLRRTELGRRAASEKLSAAQAGSAVATGRLQLSDPQPACIAA